MQAQDMLEGSAKGHSLPVRQRGFFYMPYVHSKSPFIHAQAIALFSQPGLEGSLDFALRHKAIIDRLAATPTETRCWSGRPVRRKWPFSANRARPSEKPVAATRRTARTAHFYDLRIAAQATRGPELPVGWVL